MKIKQIVVLAMVSAIGAAGPVLQANTITMYQDAYSYPASTGVSGGEFNAVTSPLAFAGFYSPETAFDIGHGLGFETFCVQVGVEFNVGQAYNYTLGQNMVLSASSSTTVPLTLGAAYLYYLFATGSPNLGYDFVNPGNRLADAGLFQSALWYLEGGQTWSGDPFDPATNPYYLLALSTFGANATSPSGGAYGVDIMNLTDANGDIAQNQLVYTGTSVPEGGSTVLLLGLGFAGLALARLRWRKLA